MKNGNISNEKHIVLIDRIEAQQNPTEHTLVALVENKPGVLNRVAG